MRILVTGASGLIGRALAPHLRAGGHEVVRFSRRPVALGREVVHTDLAKPELGVLEGFDAVIHLAGASVARRWTRRRRAEIVASRRDFTMSLCGALARTAAPPGVFISASGINFYGSHRSMPTSETAASGEGFLAEICREWEAASAVLAPMSRLVYLRLAAVLARGGGMLAKLLPAFWLGGGAVMGSGRQMVSWIALADVLRAIEHVLRTPSISGPVNVCSPCPVSNREFTKILARVMHRPAFLRIPEAALRLAFGEMADETILASVNAVPEKLVSSGFVFERPTLEEALRSVLGEVAGPSD